ncbi:MAG TPA: methylmalonyl-CoA mutase family protein [Blastocatellia bacterium]|jgi:methylmalonyl-CoA mutase N-terminal domain/subunit|nr:methylmalonyl-CoA mutase family protein [Blastocatellia bacterium]
MSTADLTNRLEEAEREWEEQTLNPMLERSPENKERFTTVSLTPVERLYTPNSLPDFDYEAESGFPGQPPYTRGIHATGYRGKLWTMRQFAGFGSAFDTNLRFKYLLEHGQTGLSVAFDLPTLMGFDSDHPFSEGEVGKCGVAISSLADMEVLFDGIPLESVTTSMTINAPASMILAMFLGVAEKQGADWKKLGGTLQNDILKEYIAQKEWIYPPRQAMRLIVDTIEFCTKEVPHFNPVSISGYHIREAGSTALQELAFTLRDGIEYVQYAINHGMDVDDFAPRLSFFFNSHNDFLEEIAKYRAARRIWYRVMKDRFGARNPRSWALRFHTQTAGVSLTAQQPLNNIVRVAIQALAGVLGGTQSLHTDAYDEALALPSDEAALIALRTQQIIAHESGVTNTVDPLGGSYFIEKLTRDMEEGAMEYFRKIDDFGGMVEAIDAGFPQREIQESSYQYQLAVDSKDKIIVGVNEYVMKDQPMGVPLLQIDESTAELQAERLKKLRVERNSARVQNTLKALADGARAGHNTMPLLLDCVREYATLGEMCDALRPVLGEYQEPMF